MMENLLAPVREGLIEEIENLPFAEVTRIHREIEGLPDLDGVKIAFFGVMEDRGSKNNRGCADGPDNVRKELYKLHPGAWPFHVADLGNIYKGETLDDTYFAIKEVMFECMREGIAPIILGGSQDLTFGQYRAYDKMEQSVNLTSIDCRLDLGKENGSTTSENFLSQIILSKPYNLFNFAALGYQTYYAGQEELSLMERMYFDLYRLGALRGNIKIAEPAVRDADAVSFDMAAIRWSDAPATAHSSPNGLSGEEACAISRYCGISDKVSSFGIYEYNPKFDPHYIAARLIAQMIWYFVDGYCSRTGDYPFSSKKDYTKYRVMIDEGDYELTFYKSPKSGRWWIEIPIETSNHARHMMVPCAHEDYEEALKGQIPDRWWKARTKALA